MNNLIIGGSLLFSEPDCPTREGEVVDTLEDIYNIPSPRVGMRVFVKDTKKSYIVTKLKEEEINGVLVPNAKVDEFELWDMKATEEEMLKRIQGTSEESNPYTDGFKFIGHFTSVDTLSEALDNLKYNSSENGQNRGYFRFTYLLSQAEVVNYLIGVNKVIQVIRGNFTVEDGKIKYVDGFGVIVRSYTFNKGWSGWSIVIDSDTISEEKSLGSRVDSLRNQTYDIIANLGSLISSNIGLPRVEGAPKFAEIDITDLSIQEYVFYAAVTEEVSDDVTFELVKDNTVIKHLGVLPAGEFEFEANVDIKSEITNVKLRITLPVAKENSFVNINYTLMPVKTIAESIAELSERIDNIPTGGGGTGDIADGAVTERKLSTDVAEKLNTAYDKANLADALFLNDGIVFKKGVLIEGGVRESVTGYAYSNKILGNGETITVDKGYKIVNYKLYEGEEELWFDNNYNKATIPLDKGYVYQFSVMRDGGNAITNYNDIVKSFIRKPYSWDSNSNLNNFTPQGRYTISGSREANAQDNMPIYNGGTVEARLEVIENENTLVQILTLLNVGGGDGNIYKRTRKDNTWGAWGKLQTNVDVDTLKSELQRLINLNTTAITNEVTRAKNAEQANTSAITKETQRAKDAEDKLTKDIEYLRDSTVVYGEKPEILKGAVQSDGSYYSGTSYSARVNKFNGGTTILLNDGYYFTSVLRRNADNSVAEFINFSDKPKYYRAEDANSIYELNIAKGNGGAFSTDEFANIIAEVTLFGSSSSGGTDYILPVATTDVLGGVKSAKGRGYIGESPAGREYALTVDGVGFAFVTIPVGEEVDADSNEPVSGKAVANAIATAITNTLNTEV